MDKAEQLIEDVRVRLDALTGGAWPATKYVVGKKKGDESAAYPRIVWVEAGGSIEPARRIGGINGSIQTKVRRYALRIWHSDVENVHATLDNLILAVRQTAYGPNVRWGDFAEPDDAYNLSGRVLEIPVELLIPVGNEVVPTADVQSASHKVYLGLIWGGFDYGGASKWGGSQVC